jgi:hypothetical protein
MKHLSDIYISQEEMYLYRDSRKEDLKDIEKQICAFEGKINSFEGSKMSLISVDGIQLSEIKEIQYEFQELQDELVLTWSIVSTMSEDIKRFHTNLRIMESINSSENEKYEAKKYLSDYKRHEDKIEQQKLLKPQMDEHHCKIDEFIEK